MRARRIWPVVALALALGSGAASAAANPLHLGSQLIEPCPALKGVYCGRIRVPLERAISDGPTISIAYRWYPARSGHAVGTVVPVEGGPGFPSIGSAGEYTTMYGPLLRNWNMLLVDNRGTGASTPIDCPALQDFSGPTDSEAFRSDAAACAAQLNSRWHARGGAPIHASDLFDSAAAAADMAQLIRALGVGPVDLYGDSYGSFYAQVFAEDYPQLLRSVILDSTYSIDGLEPWYRSSHEAMPADFDAACERWQPCAAAERLGAWARIGELATLLRSHPLSGVVPGPQGTPVAVTMNVVGLVDLVNDAAGDKRIYADIDAAARAALAGYGAPLLRLYAQRLAFDEKYFGDPLSYYSVGLYLAVSCIDYPQLFSMAASFSEREAEFAAAQAALPSSAFAPFTTAEWLAQNENTEAYSACLQWPAPTIAVPPVTRTPPLLPATLPVLVLGGELDTWTPPGDHPKILAYLGGDARFIEIANATHVVGEGDTVCGSQLVRAFVRHPRSIDRLNASCANEPPIHAVGVYPQSVAEERPLTATGGRASEAELRAAAAAVQTASDAVERDEALFSPTDAGLTGGTVRFRPDGDLRLEGDALVPGFPVSGSIDRRPAAPARDGEAVDAKLTFDFEGAPATLTARWTTAGATAVARVVGTFGGRRFSAQEPAP